RWTVRLHEGVAFHDGRPLTSADVKFTVEYLQKNARPRWVLTNVDRVETPDPLTAIFVLKQPQASFVLNPLADLPIIPQHVWSSIERPLEQTTQLPIGSGPYRLVEYAENQVHRFQANESYIKGRPIVNEIVMPYIATTQAAFTAVQSGQADAVSASLTPELKPQFNQGGLKTAGGAGYRGWYLYMNTGRPPFDKPEFRQAMAAATNSADIVATALLGAGATGSPGFVHRAAPWSNPATRDSRFDLNRARSLLDGLGYRDTNNDGVREMDSNRLEFDLLVRNNDAVAVRAAELISQSVGQAGVKLNVTALDQTTAGARTWPDYAIGATPRGDYTIAMFSWAAAVQQDPDFLRSMFHSSTTLGTLNRAGYKNTQYDELSDQQSKAVDEASRNRILAQMQEILARDMPAYPVFYPEDIFPYRVSAFDRWVYYQGVGILNKATLLAPR
ncbi:MAG TPA: ABC transporter substrate-binding protein, partial [Acidimicrobiales bacterium]|nr:ABC transporter substrate-binding protein [Acidimicrobiales bacterium]